VGLLLLSFCPSFMRLSAIFLAASQMPILLRLRPSQ
jgi:hypothetical protein